MLGPVVPYGMNHEKHDHWCMMGILGVWSPFFHIFVIEMVTVYKTWHDSIVGL